jgi:hypothetical protein
VRHLQTAAVVHASVTPLVGHNELIRALIAIEMGDSAAAADLFKQLVARDPDNPARPLIERYYGLLTGQDLPAPPETEDAPVEPEPSDEGSPDDSNQPAQPPDESDRPSTTNDLKDDAAAPGEAAQQPADADAPASVTPGPDPRR